MALLSLKEVSVGYGGRYLLEGINLQIERGERVCLRGRNGAGKSTLMKLINGELPPDEGELVVQPGMRVGRLIQEVPLGSTGTVFEEIARGLGPAGELLSRARHLNEQLTAENEVHLRHELAEVQQELGADAGWELQQQVERVIDRLSLDGSMTFATLSSGLKRRVLLGQALVTEPDVLLLDEPTNHLDIEAIGWLEEFLLRYEGTLVFVTHDRMFLERLATRIVEIDRARLFDWTCDYKTFLVRKEAALEAEEKQQAVFDQKLAQEEVWIRQGIKARRTRNEGRVRALERLRAERSDRREKVGNVKIQAQDVARSGSIVIKASGISHAYDKPVIRDLSTTIMRGDRVGIIGPNGAGKTTLLRILLGQMPPQSGTVKHGTQLEVAYFDQLRAQLNEEKSAQENVADGNDEVLINGKSRHVIGYLNDFLFSAERARSLVRYLSGGERNRLLLAKLFTKPANLLVLDEPTNDLDAETLELLEELLQDFPGTVLIVSHDRAFLNNVVTSTLVFEGDGIVKEYAGGYDDWMRARPVKVIERAEPAKPDANPVARPERQKSRKLSFKDQRELETLPQTIESLETEQQELNTLLADPAFYQQESDRIATTHARLAALQEELSTAYERWETLEELRE